jgi:hypothetical protein
MGALDHISDLFDCSGGSSKHKHRKQLQVTNIIRSISSLCSVLFIIEIEIARLMII